VRRRSLLARARAEVDAYLSLGSNLGDRDQHLRRGISELDAHQRITVAGVSGVYETEPVGGVEQDRYFNLVLHVRTDLPPRELLAACQRVEAVQGRDREHEQRWGPRPLDVDIVLYGDLEVDEDDLTIPHARLHERAFVLVPLMEVHPGGTLPDGTRLSKLVTRLAPIEGVALAHRYEGMPGGGPGRPAGPGSPAAIPAEDWEPPRGAPPGTER